MTATNTDGLTVGDIRSCFECNEYAADGGPALLGACASVGIERGKSTEMMLLEYLAAYHRRGHVAQS